MKAVVSKQVGATVKELGRGEQIESEINKGYFCIFLRLL